MSSCASHLHMCSFHVSEHFPRCRFCNPALLCSLVSPFAFPSCSGIKPSRNGPRLDMWPWFTTGRPPVKFRIIWTSFGTPTVNRGSNRPRVCCSPKPLQDSPITHLRHSHVHRRSITIPWPKTALHLELPNSFYL